MKTFTVVCIVIYCVLRSTNVIVSTKVRRRTRTGLVECHLCRDEDVVNGIKYDFARVTGKLKAESRDRMVAKRFQIDISAR